MIKKPSQLFESKISSNEDFTQIRSSSPLMSNFNETFDKFKNTVEKVDELNEKFNSLTEDLNTKLSKDDLDGTIFSHLYVVEENFRELEKQFKSISRKTLREFKGDVAQLASIVEDFIAEEIPNYKNKVTETEVKISQQFKVFQESVENELVLVKENLEEQIEDFDSSIENKLVDFNHILVETKNDTIKVVETYDKLRKILENKVHNDEDKIQQYSQVLENFDQRFTDFENDISVKIKDYENLYSTYLEEYQKINSVVEEKLQVFSTELENKFGNYDHIIETFREEVDHTVLEIKSDVVINEKHLKKVEKFLEENHQELIELKEEVFGEIQKLPYGDIQENVNRLNRKIQYIEDVYKNIEPEVIVKEVIQEGLLNEPPSTKNEDPLTPLNKNFVTLEQLQQHYRLFINRIQQQLSTLGGGGETRLKYLDDIVGIATNPSEYDGKFLKYNHSIGKFEFETVSGGGGSQTLDDTLLLGNTSTLGMSVGVVTATSYYGDGSNLSGVVTSLVGYATEGYVDNAIVGFITSGSLVGYATEGYVDNKVGLSTSGLLSSTGDGSSLTGIVTSIVAGSGISIDSSTGSVTITNTGGGGGATETISPFLLMGA